MATKTKTRLTALSVQRIKAPKGGRMELFDAVLPGFGIRITDKDARSYFCMCMAGSGPVVRNADGEIIGGRRLRRFTIGNARVIPLDEAREKARDILRGAAAGEDPTTARELSAPTFRGYATAYLERRKSSLRPSTYVEWVRLLTMMYRRWDNLPLDQIRSQDVVAFLDDTVTRAPVHANRLLSALKTMFADAVRRGVIGTSPVAMLKPPTKERPRERALTDAEIALFWQAAGNLGWPWGDAFRLLLLTGQRRGQVQLMEWGEIDLERRTWLIAGHKMKTGRPHDVSISDPALEILTQAQDAARRLGTLDAHAPVFHIDGKPLAAFGKAKARLDRLMQHTAREAIPGWTLHDLRRTLTHGLAQLSFPPHVADKILAHSAGTIHGVAAVYNQYQYLGERRDALVAWGNRVAEIIGRGQGNVVPMVGKR
jgi:integrase